jgi:3-oxoacyl-[acyl-carrier-protein] synthase III
MKVGLETVVSYFPEKIMQRSDFAYLDAVIPEGQGEMFKGPDEVRRFEGEHAVEIMAERVTRKCLDSAGLEPSDIDFIVSANIGGRRLFPMVGTYIHHKVGFKAATPVVNIQNFCASLVDGINLGWNLVLSGRYKRVLVVAVTGIGAALGKTGWGIDQTNPAARFFGDGSGAAIVSADNLKCEFLSYANRTLGELYDHLSMELMPVMNPNLKEKAGVKSDTGIYMSMDEWFIEWGMNLGKTIIVPTIEEALKEAGLTLSDLDMVLLHHPMDFFHNKWIQDGIAAGIAKEKWKEAFNKIGNCGNVDVAYKLAELSEQGVIRKGSIIALYPPGLGGHTPCMIIRWLV